jgi:hypothetical protein
MLHSNKAISYHSTAKDFSTNTVNLAPATSTSTTPVLPVSTGTSSTATTTSAPSTPSTTQSNSLSFLNNAVTVTYQSNGAATQFTVTWTLDNTVNINNAWLALGFNSAPQMVNHLDLNTIFPGRCLL